MTLPLVTSDNYTAHLQLAWYDDKCYSLCGKVMEPALHVVPDDALLCADCRRVRDTLIPPNRERAL